MDHIRHHLKEAVALVHPELSDTEQAHLVDDLSELVGNYKSSSRPHTAENRGLPSELAGVAFVVTCDQDGTVTEVIRDTLGLGSRLAEGVRFTAAVSPFHTRRAARFLRSVRQGHPFYDCILDLAGEPGVGRIYCSGFSVAETIVVIAASEPLSISIPEELVRLANGRPETLKPVLRQLATWQKSNSAAPSVVAASSAQEPALEPGTDYTTVAGRRRLIELAAHDLRNPVSGILAACQYLMEDAGGTMEPHHMFVLASIESSTRLALQLIQELAEIPLIRLGKPELRLRPTDIASIVQQEVSNARPLADAMKVKMDVSIERVPPVNGDPAKLAEAFQGLIVNAITSSHTPGKIEIVIVSRAGEATVGVQRELGGTLRPASSAASDSGIRKSPRKLSDVYAALLLARARRIVKAHGGVLRVESHGKHGRSWTAALPMVAERLEHKRHAP